MSNNKRLLDKLFGDDSDDSDDDDDDHGVDLSSAAPVRNEPEDRQHHLDALPELEQRQAVLQARLAGQSSRGDKKKLQARTKKIAKKQRPTSKAKWFEDSDDDSDDDDDDKKLIEQARAQSLLSEKKQRRPSDDNNLLVDSDDGDDDDDSDYDPDEDDLKPAARILYSPPRDPHTVVQLSNLEDVPHQVWNHVAEFLPIPDLYQVAATSKTMNIRIQKLGWNCKAHGNAVFGPKTNKSSNCQVCRAERLCFVCHQAQVNPADCCFDCEQQHIAQGRPRGCPTCTPERYKDNTEELFYCSGHCHRQYCRIGTCGNNGSTAKTPCKNAACDAVLCGNCDENAYEWGWTPNYCRVNGCDEGYCAACADRFLIFHDHCEDGAVLCRRYHAVDMVACSNASACGGKELCAHGCRKAQDCQVCHNWRSDKKEWFGTCDCASYRERRWVPFQPVLCLDCFVECEKEKELSTRTVL